MFFLAADDFAAVQKLKDAGRCVCLSLVRADCVDLRVERFDASVEGVQ